MVPDAVGYGAGHPRHRLAQRLPAHPRRARAPATAPRTARRALLETNLDHLSPEQTAFAAEQLLAEGALDVWLTPIVMKKGRAAVLLSVLPRPDRAEQTAERIVALTGTLGVRRTELEPLRGRARES